MRFLQSIARIRHMLTKEFIQTLRDPHTRWLLFGPAQTEASAYAGRAESE